MEYLKQGYMQFRFRGFRGGYKESHRAVRRRDSKQIHRCEKDKVKSRELWVNNFAMIRLSTFCITEWAPDQVKRLQWHSEKEQKGVAIKFDGVPYLKVGEKE